MVDWSRGMIGSWGIGVDGSALVGNLGDIPAIVVGCVTHCLDAAIGEGDGIGAWMHGSSEIKLSFQTCDDTGGVSCLGLLELAARIGVCDAVLVLVRSRLSFDWSVVHWRVVRGWCVGYHWRSVNHGGFMHQRCVVDGSVVDWCMVDGGVVDWAGVVQRGVMKAVVATTVPLNSVAVLCALLLLLLKHHAFGYVVGHGSPLQIEAVKGVVLVSTSPGLCDELPPAVVAADLQQPRAQETQHRPVGEIGSTAFSLSEPHYAIRGYLEMISRTSSRSLKNE